MMTKTEKSEISGNSILTLSDSAIAKIKDMMKNESKESCALRVDVTTGGCAGLSYNLRFQKDPYDNDIIFNQGDLKVYLNP